MASDSARGQKVVRRNLGARIRSLRIRARLTQEQCAVRFRVSRPTWTNIESGKHSIPSEMLSSILRIVGADVDDVETVVLTLKAA